MIKNKLSPKLLSIIIACCSFTLFSSIAIAATGIPYLLDENNDPSFISEYTLTPDEKKVVFLNTVNTNSDIYVVPIEGGVPLKLNNDFTVDYLNVTEFEISPDGERVVYKISNSLIADNDKLYSISINGGDAVEIGDGLRELFYDFNLFKISPDSTRVVYEAYGGLYSVPIIGGASTEIENENHFIFSNSNEEMNFQISDDSNYIVYGINRDVFEEPFFRLTSKTIDGNTIPAFDELAYGTYEQSFRYKLAPNTNKIIFKSELQNISIETNDIFSSSINSTQDFQEIVSNIGIYDEFIISPDGKYIVYSLQPETGQVNSRLFSIPVSGGSPVLITENLTTFPFSYDRNNKQLIALSDFQISPDSSRIVYKADEETFGIFELYSKPISGGSRTKLNETLTGSNDDISAFKISPDSKYVAYTADISFMPELSISPISASNSSILLNRNNDGIFDFNNKSDYVYYQNQIPEILGSRGLFRIPATGGTPEFLDKVHKSIFDYTFTADDSLLIYKSKTILPDANFVNGGSQGYLWAIDLNATEPNFTWNIDGGTEPAKPLTDGLLLLRSLFGFNGDSLIDNAIDSDATRNNASDIQSYIQAGIDSEILDIDGNGEVKPLTDGLLVLRYLFGFRGDSLIDGVIASDATRNTANEIEEYLNSISL